MEEEMENKDIAQWKCRYRLEKREGDINVFKSPEERLAFLRDTIPYEVIEGEGNCLLNTGIDEMWDLIVGDSANHFDNSSAQIGVGDDDTAADPSQTDLQAATNKTYKGMEASYPTSTSQKATFKASFGDSEANYTWNEWVVKQATSAKCLNRKVDALGTKSSGTWTLEVSITLS
jgi:hypothetical protein